MQARKEKYEVTIRDLIRNSLRIRPDRIVVGEVRDAAALRYASSDEYWS